MPAYGSFTGSLNVSAAPFQAIFPDGDFNVWMIGGKAIHQLHQSVDQGRDWARGVAEDAADRMASRLRDDWQAKGLASGPSSEVQALETALETVRTNYETADRRNQDTLRAVHQTLEQIVNKLTELEQLRGGPQTEVQAEPVFAAALEISPTPESAHASPDFIREAGSVASVPLDPRPSLNEPPPAVQDDFIAAARRAAQAAARQASPPTASRLLGSQGKLLSRFSLLFRKQRPAAQPASPVLAAPEKADPGKRRRLIFLSILLLVAASAYAYNETTEAPTTALKVEEIKPSASSGVREDFGKSDAAYLWLNATRKEPKVSLI
jgi:hypothetical protein